MCVPAHSLVVKDPDGNHPRRRVLVKVTLPGVTSADQVDLEVAKVGQSKSWHYIIVIIQVTPS